MPWIRIWEDRITIRAGSCKLGLKREAHSTGQSTVTGVAAAPPQGGDQQVSGSAVGPQVRTKRRRRSRKVEKPAVFLAFCQGSGRRRTKPVSQIRDLKATSSEYLLRKGPGANRREVY